MLHPQLPLRRVTIARKPCNVKSSGSAVVILVANDIIQFGSGDLDKLHITEGFHAVPSPGRDMHDFTGSQYMTAQCSLGIINLQVKLSARYSKGLYLHPVMLERESMSRTYDQDLAYIALGLGPDFFIPPRLVDPTGLSNHGALAISSSGWPSLTRSSLRIIPSLPRV